VLALFTGRFADCQRFIDEAAELADRIGEPDAPNVLADLRLSLTLLRDGMPAPSSTAPRDERRSTTPSGAPRCV
jgi:hypothetical protein